MKLEVVILSLLAAAFAVALWVAGWEWSGADYYSGDFLVSALGVGFAVFVGLQMYLTSRAKEDEAAKDASTPQFIGFEQNLTSVGRGIPKPTPKNQDRRAYVYFAGALFFWVFLILPALAASIINADMRAVVFLLLVTVVLLCVAARAANTILARQKHPGG